MTTGRRVAQKRKELGLSQEALGEKLGVSRQSIYKWESDSALPEVEKLVALSRLFGVSVGWLLGVEEEAAPSGGELTAEQLALVEEIAARYAPKPRLSEHRRTVVKLSAVTAAVCLCLVLWGFYQRLEDLTRNFLCGYTDVLRAKAHILLHHGANNLVVRILKYHSGRAAHIPQIFIQRGILLPHPDRSL